MITNIFNVLVEAVKLVTQGLCHVICSLSKKLNWSSDQLNVKKGQIFKTQNWMLHLLSNSENRKNLKNLRNIDCVPANYNKVQDTQANLTATN